MSAKVSLVILFGFADGLHNPFAIQSVVNPPRLRIEPITILW